MLKERKLILRTRVLHHCCECNKEILPGSSCRREVHIYPQAHRSYRFRVYYWCKWCYFWYGLLSLFIDTKKRERVFGPPSDH